MIPGGGSHGAGPFYIQKKKNIQYRLQHGAKLESRLSSLSLKVLVRLFSCPLASGGFCAQLISSLAVAAEKDIIILYP